MDGRLQTTDRFDALTAEAHTRGRYYYTIAYRIVRDADAAEDAVQQAFVKAIEHRDALRNEAALRAWLARTTVNQSLQCLRRRKTERRVLSNVGTLETDQTSADPGNQLAIQETIGEALADLPEPTRTIVVLRLMHGLSGKETAQRLACSASEISRRLHAGIDRLRVTLGKE